MEEELQSDNLSSSIDTGSIDESSSPSVLSKSDIGSIAALGTETEKQSLVNQANQVSLFNQLSGQGEGQIPVSLSQADMFPGMSDPILKGSYSGKMIGSMPIFTASGQYLPYNILNKKEEAFKVAEEKRKSRQASFDFGKRPELNNQLYQPEFDKLFLETQREYIDKAKMLGGKDWDLYLKDPSNPLAIERRKRLMELETLAGQANQLFSKSAEVLAYSEKGGDTAFSPETVRMAKDLSARVGEFENKTASEIIPYIDKFNGSYDLDAFFKKYDVVKNLKGRIQSSINPKTGYIEETELKTFQKEIEILAKTLTTGNGRYSGDNIVTEQMIKDRLNAYLPPQQKKSIKMEPGSVGAGQQKKLLAQERYNRLNEIATNSEVAKEAARAMLGVKAPNGKVITDVVVQSPSDVKPYMDVVDFFSTKVDEISKKRKKSWGFIYSDDAAVEELKTSLNEVLTGLKDSKGFSLGISEIDIKKGSASKPELINIKLSNGSKVTYDLTASDSKKKLTKSLLESGGYDYQNSNKNVFIVSTTDNKGLGANQVIDLSSPEGIEWNNEVLNTAKNTKVGIDELRLYDENKILVGEKGVSSDKTQQTQQTPNVKQEILKELNAYPDILKFAKENPSLLNLESLILKLNSIQDPKEREEKLKLLSQKINK